MMPKSNARKGRRNGADLQADILKSASHLFAQRGYGAVTTRDICAASNVPMSGVYRHFRDKRTLYVDCILAAFESVYDETFGALDRRLSDQEVLFQCTRALCNIHGTDGDVTKLVLRQMLEDDGDLFARVTRDYVAEPSQRLLERVKGIVGPEFAMDLIFRVFAMSFGFPRIHPMLASLGWDLPQYDNPAAMAAMILSIACPGYNWQELLAAAMPPTHGVLPSKGIP